MKPIFFVPLLALTACQSPAPKPYAIAYPGPRSPFACGHPKPRLCSKDFNPEERALPLRTRRAAYDPSPLPGEGIPVKQEVRPDFSSDLRQVREEMEELKNIVQTNAQVTNANDQRLAEKLRSIETRPGPAVPVPAPTPGTASTGSGLRLPSND